MVYRDEEDTNYETAPRGKHDVLLFDRRVPMTAGARESSEESGPNRRVGSESRVLIGLAWSLTGLGVLALLAFLVWYSSLPSVASLPSLVRETDAQHRTPYASLDQIPLSLQEALIATEDERFYQNQGLDLFGLGRAAFEDLRTGQPNQGGSTITEQLAKVVYVGNDDTLGRKLESMGLALKLAHRYSKAEVLTLYLNRVYLGHGAYGVEAASEIYFHKPVSRLDLAQCALLAGLPQAPSAYDPLLHPAAAKQRQAEVLERMVQQGLITPSQADSAKQSLQQWLNQVPAR